MAERLAALNPALLPQGWAFAEVIYDEGPMTVVRCTTPLPQFPTALAKIINTREAAGQSMAAAMRYESEILVLLRGCPFVTQTIGFTEQPQPCLFAEDHRSDTVLKMMSEKKKLTVEEKVAIALGAVRGLDAAHRAHVLHNNISPLSVVISRRPTSGTAINATASGGASNQADTKTGAGTVMRVLLVGFHRAVRLPVPAGTAYAGYPAYMAPEHTGRTSATLDLRSDLYSFGMFIYDLFAGGLPLPLPMTSAEWVHAHVARVLPPAMETAPTLVPPMISAMIDILLKKDKADRYQSAHGLERDLARFQAEMGADPFAVRFPLRLYDRAATLTAPHALLGRENEMAKLEEVFDVAMGGTTQVVYLPGPSGMGKSALIEQFRRKVMATRPDVVWGYAKCEPNKRSTPYSLLILLMESLTESFIARGPQYVEETAKVLLANLSSAGAAALTEVVPAVERIIGPQTRSPAALARSQERAANGDVLFATINTNQRELLSQGVMGFFAALGTPARPVVLVAENWQWVDDGTLYMTERVLGEAATRYIMGINLFRSDEVMVNPVLQPFLDSVVKNPSVTFMPLEPLTPVHVNELISVALGRSIEDCAELSALIAEHSRGSPFHTMALLQTCVAEQLIVYDYEARRFTYDVDKIRGRVMLSDDLADIVATRLAQLPRDVTCLLTTAACVGADFALSRLCQIMGAHPDEISPKLLQAEDMGILAPMPKSAGNPNNNVLLSTAAQAAAELDPCFRFTHRKLHTGCLARHPEVVVPTHLAIARTLLARDAVATDHVHVSKSPSVINLAGNDGIRLSLELLPAVAFEVCGHYAAALASAQAQGWANFIETFDESLLRTMIRVSLAAVAAAKRTTAFSSARDYLAIAREALTRLAARVHGRNVPSDSEPDVWTADPVCALAVYKELLAIDDVDHVHAESALSHVKELKDRIALMTIKGRALTSDGKFAQTIEWGARALRELGEPMPGSGDEVAKESQELMAKIEERIAAVDLEAAFFRPAADYTEKQLMIADALHSMIAAVYLVAAKLVPIVAGRALWLALNHGCHRLLTYPITLYGYALLLRGNVQTPHQLGTLCIEFERRQGIRINTTETRIADLTLTGQFVVPLPDLPRAFADVAADHASYGNRELAAIAVSGVCRANILGGHHLPSWLNSRTMKDMIALTMSTKYASAIGISRAVLRVAYELAYGPRWFTNLMIDHPCLATHGAATPGANATAEEFAAFTAASWSGPVHSVCLSLLHLCMGRPQDAYDMAIKGRAELAREHVDISGILEYFTLAMSATELITMALDEESKKQLRASLELAMTKLKLLASLAPTALEVFHDVARAGVISLEGNMWDAVAAYNQAITLATSRHHWHVIMLAHRALARLWRRLPPEAGARYVALEEEHAEAARVHWGCVALSRVLPDAKSLSDVPLEGSQSGGGNLERTMVASEGAISLHLDSASILRASRAISSELHLPKLMQTLMQSLMESVGAQAIAILRLAGTDYVLEAAMATDLSGSGGDASKARAVPAICLLPKETILTPEDAPLTVLNTCVGIGSPFVVGDARKDIRCSLDPHVVRHQPVSMLCAPLLSRGKVVRVVYVQNNLVAGAFSPRRLTIFEGLASQAAVSIENAFLYAQLEGEKAELEVSRDVAMRANAAKSEFLAMISHEIRTPMNGIMSMVALLRDAHLGPEYRDHLDVISSSGEILLHLIESVLDYSSLESGRFEIKSAPLNISHSLAACAKLVGVQASSKGLELKVLDSRVPLLVVGDVVRLRQIVLNLLSNAIKYTERGTVTLSYQGREVDVPSGTQFELTLSVADTGVGIASEDVTKLFKPFSQVDSSPRRKVDGVGLGLAITHTLASRMGGRVWVDSTPGHGSIFHCTLMFGMDESSAHNSLSLGMTRAASDPALTSARDLRILIVDDNHINRKVLSKILEKLHFEVSAVATNGIEAVELAKKQVFDLILMDIFMPEMDGITATDEIRKLAGIAQPVIVAVTASALHGDRERFLEHGMNGYLCKPLQIDALKEILHAVVDGLLVPNGSLAEH